MAHLLQIHEPGCTPEPHAFDCVIGIDLGTTYSVVAIKIDGEVRLLAGPDGGVLIPSVVAYTPQPVVGHAAFNYPDAIRSAKRVMGRAFHDISKEQDGYLFDQVDAFNSEKVVHLRSGDQVKSVVEISADILRYLKTIAQIHVGEHPCRAVITVPAHFDDAARNATRDAAQLAGIEVLRLINEPTAAALAYGLDKGMEGVYAVYDLGGGTFDFSLLNLRNGIFQVLATGGDTRLGGDDFDQRLADYINDSYHLSRESKEILSLARAVKEALSEADSYTFSWKAQTYTVTRETFDSLIDPLIQKSRQVIASVLADAGKSVHDIQGVVLVGGSTRVPAVVEAVRQFFQQEPLRDIHPDHAVAMGAAYQAHALVHGSENVLLDVAPLSLGVEMAGGLMEKIIERNTPIPVQKAQVFTTSQDGQSAMKIHILQGERELVSDCRSLGEFILTDIPPMVAGAARIQVTFSLDADGLLSVSAEEKITGHRTSIEVKPSYGLTTEEINRMLLEAHIQGQSDMQKRLLRQVQVDAQRLIDTVTSALVHDAGLLQLEEKTVIEGALIDLNKVLGSDDRDTILFYHQNLEKACASFAEKRMNAAIGRAFCGQKVEEITAEME